MISRERFKEKLNIFHSHFDIKDLIGLSALIFGLLLSNSSMKKQDQKNEENRAKMEQNLKESGQKSGRLIKAEKKIISPAKSSQRKTAALRSKKKDKKN